MIADKLSGLAVAALRVGAWRPASWLIFPQHGLQHYLRTHYADKTFEHLYRWNPFDTALLIPYFVVMVVLAFYGIHRYQLVYRYYKHRKNAAQEPESHFAELPRITLQLPIFNEQFVIERLIQACCHLDYPKDKLEIQVLDDSTDDTVEVAQAAVEQYQSLGYKIAYIHRTDRHGFKAGALQAG
jgi:cellulose synthase/poly-beta-1,6-N-acetylglucosamine synthase-like glycosyltransferase